MNVYLVQTSGAEIEYGEIQRRVEQNDVSDGMARCGQEGFNLRMVPESDLETVERLSSLRERAWRECL